MHPSTAIHDLSLPSTTHQPKPIEIPLVQPGRVRLVMRNRYISRLPGAVNSPTPSPTRLKMIAMQQHQEKNVPSFVRRP
ncbi:unnamed protein product, partial [Mesorhabditis belari]|uniref:Uncharacterized protein n=1 Tax=Mesorhabditis belari TaxID=2138241 RepID=A0AAF3F293_9BILA